MQGSVGGFNWNVTGSQFNTGGNLPHDDSSQTAYSGRLGYDFPWHGELSLTGRYSYLDLELPIFSTAPTVFDPNAQNQLETGLYKLAYTQKVTDWWNVSASFGQWFNNSHFRDTPPPGDNTTISAELMVPVAIEKGSRFAIREGGRTVGAGTITEILD